MNKLTTIHKLQQYNFIVKASYQSTLPLAVQLVICLQTSEILTLYQIDNLFLRQINTIVEVTTPEQVVMVPHLTTLSTTRTYKQPGSHGATPYDPINNTHIQTIR